MEQTLASGYIKKADKLKSNQSIKEEVIQYTGELKIQDKKIQVDIYSNEESLSGKEIFVKLSHRVQDKLYGMI